MKQEINDNKQSSKNKEKKSNLPLIIACIIGILVIIGGIIGFIVYKNNRTVELANNHVYVCDNPSNNSEFDTWLKEDLKVKWVPSYIVIKDGVIIGAFNGDIPLNQFKEQLGTILALNEEYGGFQGYEITNLNGETIKDYVLFNSDTIEILEISWIDCPDCIHQDENYTQEIYKYLGIDKFYRYYIRSDKQKVIDKYQNSEK